LLCKQLAQQEELIAEPQRLTRYYVKRLECLGHKVTLESYATG